MSILLMPHLPPLTPEAAAHSARLTALIKQRIHEAGGWLSFADFMQMALYEPGLGYYVAGARKFGAEGDFVTAPEISALFSRSIAAQCCEIFSSVESVISACIPRDQASLPLRSLPSMVRTSLGNACRDDLPQDSLSILEFGAGTGIMAADILLELEKLNALPEKYFILEISPDLQQRQHETLQKKCAHLLSRVEWLSALPENFVGVVLANEVLDAMPVHLFEMYEGKIFEKGIVLNAEESETPMAFSRDVRTMDGKERKGKDAWSREMPSVLSILKKCENHNDFIHQECYTSEICFAIKPWLKNLYNAMKQGVVILIDYGFPAREYYHPDRNTGTLMCHYRHHAHTDPLIHIGLQDITAHVDFTAVATAAKEAGFELSGYTNQANFLMALDILNPKLLKNMNTKEHYQHAQAIKKLLLPSEMGELFKVIALNKKCNVTLQGFSIKNDIERVL